jgi:filamin
MAEPDEDHVIEEPTPLPLWQEIQKRTFTNWVNLRLSPSFINDLFVDMSDGLQLIKLIEVLTERSLGRRNKRIEHVNQRLDNVAIALDFLQDKEGINLTNIGPSDVVERNPKLILGLMWILFRHYTIAKALPQLPHELGQKTNDKARLLQWIRSKLPASFPVSNLTSDWNDGFALAALVEGCVPGLKVGWKNWDPTTPLENTKKAMDLAHEHLGIDRMIAPEDLISSDVDEISVMAYLTNFPLMVEAKKTRGTLSNIDRHPIAGIRSAFNIRIVNPNHIPKINISKPGTSTQDSSVPVEITPTNDPHVFDVSYIPPIPGPYDISLHVTNPEEPDEKRPSDAVLKVEAVEGPGLKGLNPHSFVGEPQHLKIYNCNPQDNVRVEIIGPESSRNLIPMQWNHVNREFEGTFKPEKPGHHSVNVLCNSRSIKGSPFPTRVQELPVPEFWGRGICESLRAGEEAIVCAEYPSHISAADAQRYLKNAKLVVSSNNQEVPIKEKIDGNVKTFSYIPEDVAVHEVKTYFNDKLIGKHLVNAQYPSALSRAFGPGTEVGMENQKATFVIDRAKNEEVQFAVEGPAPSELRRNDIDDNTAIIEYTPTAPGKYYVSVLDNHGQNVKDSPFAVNVKDEVQGFYPGNAKISKLPPIVRVNEVVEFTADTRPAHSIVPTPDLYVYDPESEKIETRVQQKSDGTFKCSFCPRIVGHHQVFVAVDGVSIPPCPVKVTCVDPDKIQYSGPGIDSPLYCSPNQTHFVIDAKQAGPGNVEVEMFTGEEHQKVDVEVVDENDGSYTVKYCAPKAGAYNIKVVFAGYTLPSFEINVQQPANASGAIIEGLDNEIFENEYDDEVTDASKCVATGEGLYESTVGEISEFKVDTTEAGPGDLSFSIDGPNSSTTIVDYTPGSCTAIYSPTHPGIYKISALFGNSDENREHIPGSPFTMVADYPRDPSTIAVYDDSTDSTSTKKVPLGVPQSFIVDASKTAKDEISLDPDSLGKRDEYNVTEIEPRIWKIEYLLNSPAGRTVPLDIRYGDELLAIGPVAEVVDYLADNLKVNKISPARINSLETNIEIDVKDVGKIDRVTAKIEDLNGNGELTNAIVIKKDNGLHEIIANPEKAGTYGLMVFADSHLLNKKPIEFKAVKDGVSKDCQILNSPKEWIVNKPNDILLQHHGDDNKIVDVLQEKDQENLKYESFTSNATDLYENSHPDDKLVIVRLTPEKIQQYDTQILYDSQPVKNGTFSFVPEEKSEKLVKSKDAEIDENRSYNFALGKENAEKEIIAFALDSDKHLIPLEVNHIDDDGNARVNAHFSKSGQHVIFLFADRELLPKHVIKEVLNKEEANAFGKGLETAIVGETSSFDIVCPDRGQVKVNVKGPKSVKIQMEQKMENSCTVHWTPEVAGNYEVLIYLNKSEIPAAGSPFIVKALPSTKTSKSRKSSCFSYSAPSEVTFDCGKDVTKENLTATVRSPDGKVSQCGVRLIGDNRIGLSMKPKIVGDYEFKILEKGQEMPHSPFFVKVKNVDLPDPKKVKIFGNGLHHAVAGQDNEFFIDCQGAGYGSVLAAIDGPADAPMSCVRTRDKMLRILYRPPVTGTYHITVKFDDKIVPGSPYIVECHESDTKEYNSQKTRSPITLNKTGERGQTDSKRKAEIHLYIPNSDASRLEANISDPLGQKYSGIVTSLGRDYYSIQLKPVEHGKYFVHVTQDGKDIQGSPFSFSAGQKESSQADKVKVGGTGLEYGQTGQPQSFMIYTTQAGPGLVSAVIDGPEKPFTKLKDLRDGRVSVEYTANTPGHYFINVLFNGTPIRSTPYCVYIAPGKTSSKKRQNGVKPIAQPPYIETSQEKSPPPPSSPKSKEIREIKESKESKDLAHLDIRGLSHIMTGKSTDFEIIPTYQGESTFSIEVYGPSKVKLNTETTKEGIKVKFTPYAPGEYIITVKNNGINVGESPKKVRVEGHKLGGEGINESSVIYARYISHTSTTVTKYGNNNVEEKPYQEIIQQQQIENRAQDLVIDGFGISQFSPGKAAMFRINNIGNKTLFVGVVTAMGPCQQCSVNNCGNGSFLVSYIISDRSPGFIYIRYGDEDVPGSPFQTLPTSR